MLSIHGFTNKGFQEMDLTQLKAIPITPQGNRSDRWLGIQHGDLIETMHSVLEDISGVTPLNPQYLISPNNATVIGGWELGTRSKMRNGKYKTTAVESIPGMGDSIAFIHSNDSSRALRIVAGARVFLCSNGMVVGEIKFHRKHTNKLVLRDWLTDNLADVVPTIAASLQERVAPLYEGMIEPHHHDAGLLALARQHCLPWKFLADMDQLWNNAATGKSLGWVPEEDQDAWEFKGSKYDYFGAFSHVAKSLPAQQQLRSLERGLTLITAL